MGECIKHFPVKLIAGFIFSDIQILKESERRLIKTFGPLCLESPIWDFVYTDYYKKEFGNNLKRKFLSFRKLIKPDKFCAIKLLTNKIEIKLSKNGRRRINIDPGYIDAAKLILATTKNYSHRIYLEKGIFGEITLTYQDGQFKALPWTYPDYQTKEYIGFFNEVRNKYLSELKIRNKN